MKVKIALTAVISFLVAACGSLESRLMPKNDSSYSVAKGEKYRGKRILVSFRHISEDGSESYSGLWGTVIAVATNGLILNVEGGNDDEDIWMMPPDLGALKIADEEFYVFKDKTVIEEVDYLAEYETADSIEVLETYIFKNDR